MQANEVNQYTEKCFQGADPPCMCGCPLNVDIRAFIDKAQKGNFTTAYRLFRNQVLFPRIVSAICDQPCKGACIGNSTDTSIEMQYLEQASIAFTKDKSLAGYNVPKKDGRIAIIGGGLSGMACALKLTSRHYEVTVYEQQDHLGGRLAALMSPDVYLQEFQDEFADADYTLKLSTQVSRLDNLDVDAIFIATGAGGTDFGLLEGMDANALGTKKVGVFVGGNLLGTTPIESIENGVRASHSIEKYLKTGLMDGVPQSYEKRPVNSKLCMPDLPVSSLPGNDSGEVNKELAVAEARRCLKCDCSICIDGCDMMRGFNKMPHRIVSDVVGTLHTIEGMTKRVASRLINSCNQCGLCTTICPEHVDMEDCLLQARRFLFQEGAVPPAFHDYWMRDMANANSDAAGGVVWDDTSKNPEFLFFPGCQLGASEPDYVSNAYGFLKDVCDRTAMLLGCCGVPADWAGDEALRDEVQSDIVEQWQRLGEPTVVAACPTCLKTFSRYLPQIKTISLYEVMGQNILPEWKTRGAGQTVTVFDPCASRYYPSMQQNIRKLLQDTGFQLEELKYRGSDAQCCSFGGHIHASNPDQVEKMTTSRISENDNPYVCYCSNCRDTFITAGKSSSHVLDIFLGTASFERPAPDLSLRRQNRTWLKQSLTGDAPTKEEFYKMMEEVAITIPPDLQQKMNESLILKEDVLAAIEHCKSSGNLLKNNETGEYVGHWAQGVITFWVAFTEDDASGYTLRNVYSHRLQIQEDV